MLRLCIVFTLVGYIYGDFGLLGGYSDSDFETFLSDTSIGENSCILKTLMKYGAGYNDQTTVQTQIVNGVNYKFTILNDGEGSCQVIVWFQAWTDTMKITCDSCAEDLTDSLCTSSATSTC